MALDDVTYQNFEIVDIPESPVNTIIDISYPWYQVCELRLTSSVVTTSGEQITIYVS